MATTATATKKKSTRPQLVKGKAPTPGNGRTTASQADLPTMERPRIKDLDRLARLRSQRTAERVAIQQEEAEINEQILALMHQHKLTTYHSADNLLIELRAAEKVSVTNDAE